MKNTRVKKKNPRWKEKEEADDQAEENLNSREEENWMKGNRDHLMSIVPLPVSLSPKDLSRTLLTNIQLVPLMRSNKEDRKRRREKSKEENFHLARKKKWKENLKLKVVRKIRGNMVHLMWTGLQQVNLLQKGPSNSQFKNSLMLKLR
jgi:hypothetical protein